MPTYLLTIENDDSRWFEIVINSNTPPTIGEFYRMSADKKRNPRLRDYKSLSGVCIMYQEVLND